MKFKEIMKEKGLDAIALEKITIDNSKAYQEKIRSGEINQPSSMQSHYSITSRRIQLFLEQKGDPSLDEVAILARALSVPERELEFAILDKATGEIRIEKMLNSSGFVIR